MKPDDHSAPSPLLSATGSFVTLPCPKCDGTLARRSHRDGLVEKMISLMYVYPFRCQLCGHRFFALQWGIRYHRVPVMPGGSDDREYHRLPIQIPIMLSGRHGESHGRTSDLSLGGCTLVTSGPCRDIAPLNVRLQLPCELHPVMVEEAAVRTVQGRRIGMEFLQTAPDEKTRIGRFITSTMKESVPDCGGRSSHPRPGQTVARLGIPPNSSSAQAMGKL